MARANKYTSINFNHIYDKTVSNNSSTSGNINSPSKNHPSSSYYSTVSSSPSSPGNFSNPNNLYKNHLPSTRTHGRMLVLTRPTPKPATSIPPGPPSPSPQIPPTHQPQPSAPDHPRVEPEPDQISLRPQGRTGPSSPLTSPVVGQERPREVGAAVLSPKSNKFVPPHLRPGFAGKEEKPGPVHRQQQQQQQHQGHVGSPGHVRSPGRYGDDRRPKSGGGYDRGNPDQGPVNRPRSSGNRPSSSGWRSSETEV
ncbi:hypothetical protein Tsubulata_007372, partial [Turnera subulata]